MPAPVKRDVILSWASRPLGTAEFGYGSGPDGAFFGWDKAARFEHVPAEGRWHHVAWVYAPPELRVYVDGAPDARRELALAPKPGGHVRVGAGWNSVGRKAVGFFHGSLARVQVWDRSLSQRELRNAGGWSEPFNASPADATTVAAEEAVLRWEAGSARAASFAVRVARDRPAAEAAAPAPGDVRSAKTELRLPDAAPGSTYFWRVDKLDAVGNLILKGPVWQFTVDNGPAVKPVPRDRVAGAPQATRELRWAPGRYARSQTVYFGPDRQAVADGSLVVAEALPGSAASCPLPAGAVEYGKTYYWRVKQRNKRRQGLKRVSTNGFHYSWDWDALHLVQLNLFPGKDSADCVVGPPNHDPEDALGFLQEDLARNVADRGRVVIIFCHYCYSGGMADWWTEAAKEQFRRSVETYRVVLIHGHSHGAYFYTWKGIPAISDGATARPEGQTGDFLVVHVTGDQLAVAQRKMGAWGLTLKVPVPGPLPAGAATAPAR